MKLKYCDGEGTKTRPWMVHNAKGLEELSTISGLTSDVYIELCNDIDMNETPHQQYIDIYNITSSFIYINGNNYEIANICRYDYDGNTSYEYSSIIRCKPRCMIYNVRFINFLFVSCGFITYVQHTDSEAFNTNGFITDGIFYNCEFIGYCKIADALISNGTFYDCTFDIEFTAYYDPHNNTSETLIRGVYYDCTMNLNGTTGSIGTIFGATIVGLILAGYIRFSSIFSALVDKKTRTVNLPIISSSGKSANIYSTLGIEVGAYHINAQITNCYNSVFMIHDNMSYTLPNNTNRVLTESEMRDTSILAEVGLIPIDNGGE